MSRRFTGEIPLDRRDIVETQNLWNEPGKLISHASVRPKQA
jgi:hypothetical protein